VSQTQGDKPGILNQFGSVPKLIFSGSGQVRTVSLCRFGDKLSRHKDRSHAAQPNKFRACFCGDLGLPSPVSLKER